MDLVDFFRAGGLMESVDVLGHDRRRHVLFQSRDGQMTGIGFRQGERFYYVQDELGDTPGLAEDHAKQSAPLGELFGWKALPETLGIAKSRNATLRGNTRPGVDDYPPSLPQSQYGGDQIIGIHRSSQRPFESV